MFLNGAPLLFALLLAVAPDAPRQGAGDQGPAVRRLAATAQLAAQEYRIGVSGGRIVNPAEVEEAKLFLAHARKSADLLPHEVSTATARSLDSIIVLVGATASPDTVDARVRVLAATLSRKLGVSLDDVPAQAPLLARGAEVYRAACASCHGDAGRGDGPAGAGLDPAPANLADAAALRGTSPLDFYRRITIGVAGTAMPSFETSHSADDRWAAAVYATLLRLPTPDGRAPATLGNFSVTAKMTDAEVLAALGADTTRSDLPLGRLAAVRSAGTDGPSGEVAARVFAQVRAQLDSAYALVGAGRGEDASTLAFEAYMTFEQVERGVRAKNPALAGELETAFATLRARAAGGPAPAELAQLRNELASGLERAERAVADPLSPLSLFINSFVLLFREGLEAILIVGALLTFLVKTGAAHRRRDIHIGVGAAIGVSVLTAILIETVFQIAPAQQEVLEGITMVAATGVLFYVSYWLLSKMEVVKWNHFVKSKVQDAVTSGSSLALASAAFLAVYREGFETILFYKALFVSGSEGGTAMPVVGGMIAGGVVLVIAYTAINRFGVRLPLKPFFGVTSAFLYYMAFVFAGKGIAELQEGGAISTTYLPWAEPLRAPWLGVFPTAESLGAQALLLALFVAALVWTFLIEPRRLHVTSVLVPDAQAPSSRKGRPDPLAAGAPLAALPPDAARELLRSLERMEADLAEMRAEVERMRRHLTTPRSESVRRG